MPAPQRSPFGEMLRHHRTRRGLTPEKLSALVTSLTYGPAKRGADGEETVVKDDRYTVSTKSIKRYEAPSDSTAAWTRPQIAKVRLLARVLGLEPGSPEYEDFFAAATEPWHVVPPVVPPVEPPAQPESPFLREGREPQLDALRRKLDTATAGRVAAAFVDAPMGSGKSWLVAHACRLAVDAHPDAVVIWHTCAEHHDADSPSLTHRLLSALLGDDAATPLPALLPEAGNLDRLHRRLASATDALLRRGSALFHRSVPNAAISAATERLDADRAAALREGREVASGTAPTDNEIRAALGQVLIAYAASGPVVLVVDDLQWADTDTAATLGHLATMLAGRHVPVALVGTYRTGELIPAVDGEPHPWGARMPSLWRLHPDAGIDMGRALGGAAGRRFVEARAARVLGGLPTAAVDALVERTGGHPFFLDSLLRDLALTMEAADPDDRDATLADAMEHLPRNVQAALAHQLATLPPPALDLLQAAAVQGMVFSADVVMHVTGCESARWIAEMDDLLVRGRKLVEATGTSRVQAGQSHRYTFWHGMLRQHVLEAMGPVRRRDLHVATAEALIALYGEGWHDGTVAIAEHLAAGGDQVGAARAWIRAGDHALVQGWFRDARDRFGQVQRLPASSSEVAILAQSLIGMAASARGLNEAEEAHAWVERALTVLERRDLPELVANAHIIKGMLAFDAGKMGVGADHVGEAVTRYQRAGNQQEAARALGSLSYNLHGLGRYRDALDAAERSLAIGQKIGGDGIVIVGMIARANCWVNMGQYERAVAGYEVCRDICRDVGRVHEENICLLNISLCAIETIDWVAAAEPLDAMVQPERRVAIRLNGALEQLRGMIAEGTDVLPEVARRHFRRSRDIRRRTGQAGMLVDALAGLLRLALRERDLPAATALLAEIESMMAERGVDGVEFYSRLYLTLHDVCRALDRDDDARRYLAQGRTLLCERADMLTDPKHRHSYLNAVPANRQVMALAAELGIG